MADYQSILAYDGTAFAGFQRQRGRRTVQGEVERALGSLGWQEGAVRAAGRTDAGTHATGQVIAFRLEWKRDPARLTSALNAALPADVAVRRTEPATDGFQPRYAATWRRYRYRVVAAAERLPIQERYAWRIWPPADVGAMRSAGRVLLGEHDFGAFGTAPRRELHTRRHVRRAEWETAGDQAEFVIEADAFLYRMVRRMVSALVSVGQGRATRDDLVTALRRPTRRWQGRLAPAHGLCLEAVLFED